MGSLKNRLPCETLYWKCFTPLARPHIRLRNSKGANIHHWPISHLFSPLYPGVKKIASNTPLFIIDIPVCSQTFSAHLWDVRTKSSAVECAETMLWNRIFVLPLKSRIDLTAVRLIYNIHVQCILFHILIAFYI